MKLKLYLIEDSLERRRKIKKYFECVNELLSGNIKNIDPDFPECHKCFETYGYKKIELLEIIPQRSERRNTCDYKFSEEVDWVKKISEILNKPWNDMEKRIFVVDLALNREERKKFESNQTVFLAQTARQILDYITKNTRHKKEYILVESVLKNIDESYKRALSIRNKQLDKLFLTCVPGSVFGHGAVKERVEIISGQFENILEEMKKDGEEVS